MKKLLFATVALAFLIVPTSCNLLFSPFKQTWHITKIDLAAQDEESESIYLNAFLSFYDDGALSFFNKHEGSQSKPLYRMGQWEKNGDALNISLKRTMINTTFKIIELSKEWLVLEIKDGPQETIGTVLKCQPSELYKSSSYDLLNPENNSWRTPPDHKENHDAIKTRVLAHVNFLIAYFHMIDDKNQQYFEPHILQTPFEFYSNGMALGEKFELDDVWLSDFYDEEDAAAGGELLSQGFTSIEEYPSDENSHTKGYTNVLILVKEYIEK